MGNQKNLSAFLKTLLSSIRTYGAFSFCSPYQAREQNIIRYFSNLIRIRSYEFLKAHGARAWRSHSWARVRPGRPKEATVPSFFKGGPPFQEGVQGPTSTGNGLVDAVDALKLQYPVRGSLLHSSDSIPGCGMTSLVGSSPSSLLRSGSVSAKELESVRRIDCFGEFVSRSGPRIGNQHEY